MTSTMPHALVVTLLWPWPANSGGRIRAAAIVEALRADHEVTVLAADNGDSGFSTWDSAVARVANRRASMAMRARDIVEGAVRGDHTASRRAANAGLDKAFADVVDALRPQVVILGPPFFASFITSAHRVGASVVLDPNERLARVAQALARARRLPIAKRLRALLESWTLERMERRYYPEADAIWVASDTEQRGLQGVAPASRVRVVPNPVLNAGAVASDGVIRAVAYVGWYGHAPNEAAALELISKVMPAIRAAGGPDHLQIIGREPTEAMRAAAASQANTEITGEVPDALALLARAGLLVLPIRSGGGTRIKVLEAASIHVPIVSTRTGVEGLDFQPGRHYLLADAPGEFAKAVVALDENPELRATITQEAREAVESRFGPDAIRAAVRANLPN
jgi:glycosyltransferase involved in cell wall biosynthesis